MELKSHLNIPFIKKRLEQTIDFYMPNPIGPKGLLAIQIGFFHQGYTFTQQLF